MTGDRNIRGLLDRPARPAATPPLAEAGEEEYSAYAHGRISRHIQLTLMCWHADGSCHAFAYSYFCGATCSDSKEGFVLNFTHQMVKVTGRNLDSLLRLICQHRVAEIRTLSRSEGLAVEADAPIIENIEIHKV